MSGLSGIENPCNQSLIPILMPPKILPFCTEVSDFIICENENLVFADNFLEEACVPVSPAMACFQDS